MWLSEIFERFIEKSPVTVIVRAMMEVVLAPEKLDDLFEQTAQTGYTRELLFSTLVKMMSLVVCSIHQSIGSVYKAMSAEIGVSKTAVYDKLNRLEPSVSQALVRGERPRNDDPDRSNGRATAHRLAEISPENSRWQWSGSDRTSVESSKKYPLWGFAWEINSRT
jgi:hypothetical protein